MPRDPQTLQNHLAKSKVFQETCTFMRGLSNACPVYRKSNILNISFCFLLGVKRKSTSVIDMMKKKKDRKK